MPLRAELIALRREVIDTFDLADVGPPIELFIFGERASYQRYLSRDFPRFAAARLYVEQNGAARIFAHRGPELEIDLRHEATHALLHAALPNIPLWLDEGLAEYFELPQIRRAAARPYVEAIQANAQAGRVPRLAASSS